MMATMETIEDFDNSDMHNIGKRGGGGGAVRCDIDINAK